MAYDEALAERIRDLLATDADVTEQKMFGGLGFMVAGNMAVAASSQGGLMVRVDPADADRFMASSTATPMEMRGRSMNGWLLVPSDDVRTAKPLRTWVDRGVAYARSLPPKRGH